MKEKKPFQVGATYKLKKKYVDHFYFTFYLTQEYGITDGEVFSFTPTRVTSDNYAYMNDCCVARPTERHMFTRVDNK